MRLFGPQGSSNVRMSFLKACEALGRYDHQLSLEERLGADDLDFFRSRGPKEPDVPSRLVEGVLVESSVGDFCAAVASGFSAGSVAAAKSGSFLHRCGDHLLTVNCMRATGILLCDDLASVGEDEFAGDPSGDSSDLGSDGDSESQSSCDDAVDLANSAHQRESDYLGGMHKSTMATWLNTNSGPSSSDRCQRMIESRTRPDVAISKGVAYPGTSCRLPDGSLGFVIGFEFMSNRKMVVIEDAHVFGKDSDGHWLMKRSANSGSRIEQVVPIGCLHLIETIPLGDGCYALLSEPGVVATAGFSRSGRKRRLSEVKDYI